MKSIRTKIIVSLGSVTVAALLILGIVGIALNYTSSIAQIQQAMEATADITAGRVEQQLLSYRYVAEAFGMRSDVADPDISNEQKGKFLNEWMAEYGMSRVNLFDASGVSVIDGTDVSDREYFSHCMNGESYVSTPTVNKATGELSMIVSAPVWENGVAGSKVIGLVNFIPGEAFLNDIMGSIHISENNGAYMIDKNGYTIADTTMDTINVENIEQEAAGNKEMEAQGNVHADMRAGGSGLATCVIDGVEQVISYAPVANTDGWSLAVTVPLSDFMGTTYTGILISAILIVVSILLILVVSIVLCNRIVNPIKACANRLVTLAQGNLSDPVPVVHSKDETRILADSTRQISDALSAMIGEENRTLGAMASGNFDIDIDQSVYVGDFREVYESMRHINMELSATLREINGAADQVSAGAEQVSIGSQALSQGATEQASSVEELSATVQEISGKIAQNATHTRNANTQTQQAGDRITQSSRKMQDLMEAMEEIKRNSTDIQGIIKTIDDIAFQTNILALNAAVEAARAGAAGKGFAVVADEVRSLAGKSAKASKMTQEMIQNSIKAVENGSELASNTAKELEETVSVAGQVVEMITEITRASEEQAEAVKQVTVGLDQISSVVQTNSATAEESAAASEELSGQAGMLKSLVSKFKIAAGSAGHHESQLTADTPEPPAASAAQMYHDKY